MAVKSCLWDFFVSDNSITNGLHKSLAQSAPRRLAILSTKALYATSSPLAACRMPKREHNPLSRTYSHLTSMLHNLTHHLPILDKAPNLLRQRVLAIIVLGGQVDINAGALAGEDLGILAVLAEVDGRAIDLVEEHGGQGADDLEGEVGALDDVDRGDEAVDDDGGARRVVDGDGVGLAVDADGCVLAARDED